MNSRLIKWSDEGHILNDAQFGFRQGRGTTDCIFLLQGLIEKIINEKVRCLLHLLTIKKLLT